MTHETPGDRVRRLRKQRGLSPYQLAEKVGCTHTTIADIEANKFQRSRFLPSIARELGTTTEYLLNGDQVQEESGNYRARLVEWLETGQLNSTEITALGRAAESMITARC
jgi:transcriptional regulator with XRE-family HTH domain